MATQQVIPAAETETRQPVDLLKAYKLRVQGGLTYGQIAEAIGQPKSSIHRALTDLCAMIEDPQRLQLYHDARGGLLSAVEERLIGSLVDEGAIEKASLNNRAYAFKQVFDARRLESGQSTSNVSVLARLITQAEERLAPATPQPVDMSDNAITHNQDTSDK